MSFLSVLLLCLVSSAGVPVFNVVVALIFGVSSSPLYFSSH